MSDIIVNVQNASKLYRLGEVGTGTISQDLNRWWARVRGKEDPLSTVGEINDRTQKAKKGEKVWALKDINFQVRQGDVLGVVGKNGAGKSTLLKLMSRITAPTSGSIKIRGRIASLLEVGTGMHPEMTGRENVYLNGTILGMTKKEIDNKYEEIMDFAGCLKYAQTPVKRYSSGMKVRLGFAVAAFLEPEILVVDEVLAVGDAEFQRKAIGKIQDITHGDGRTVLFVSHNMSAVLKLCNRAILLQNGNIIADDHTEEVVSRYLSLGGTKTGEFSDSTHKIAPSKRLKVRKARLLKSDSKVYHEFDNDDEIFLQITFEVFIPGKPYSIGFELSSIQFGPIFTSTIFDDDIDRLHAHLWEAGCHTYTVKLPNQILRSGDYAISITSAIPTLEVLDIVNECLSFSIVDITSPVAKSNEGRRGAVLPVLHWQKVKSPTPAL